MVVVVCLQPFPGISYLHVPCEANLGVPDHETQAFVSDPSGAGPSTHPRHACQGASLLQ